jgi:hypothetical protein
LIGSILMANPDIDIIGLIATIFLGSGFIPYALQLLRSSRPVVEPVLSPVSSK